MLKIKDNIYWTGHIDWDLRSFHGYSTPSGSTYNAYLLLDDEPLLIDTVKHYGYDDLVAGIRAVIEPSRIKYIVSNHAEMDHSGSLPALLELCPKARVICSPKGAEGLKRHFKRELPLSTVNSGDTLATGKNKFKFFLTPMVHWPDSMVTYLENERVLFSSDAFGQHYASSLRFAEEAGPDIVFKEAAKYYANIILPYGQLVNAVLDALAALDVEMICPAHGLIFRREEDIAKIVSLYRRWANHETGRRSVIIYDTMWHSTEKMARRIYQIMRAQDIETSLINLQTTHISDAVTEIMLSRLVIMGSPMLNNHVLPTIGGLLTYIKGLKPRNRKGMTFGSYGWAQAGFKELEDGLAESGIELVSPGHYFQYIPDELELENLNDMAEAVKMVMDT